MSIPVPADPLVVVVAALVVAAVLAGLRGPRGGSRRRGARRGSGGEHVPWGGAGEPFHPRDRDLRDRAHARAEAAHRSSGAGTRDSRMDERYGGDFGPPPGAA
ncbi:MAG TPA: hypothetical protein VFG74_07210 [Miltoncostaeaceae bacterium]|nr:hypothetical protein [Miltoncostaeaceae bacterium]